MAAPSPDPIDMWTQNEKFVFYEPEPDLSVGAITMEFYELWRKAEGGGFPPHRSATRLITFFPEPWNSWARSLLGGMTEVDPEGNFHVYFPSFVIVILTQWVENSSYPSPPPFILIPFVPHGHMVYQPNAISEPLVDIPMDPVQPPPIPVIVIPDSSAPTLAPAPPLAIPPPPSSSLPLIPPPPPGLWNLHVEVDPTPPSPTPVIPLWDQNFVPFGTHDHEARTSTTISLSRPNPGATSPPRPPAPPASPVRFKRTARISIPRYRGSPFRLTIPSSPEDEDEEENSPREYSERERESEPS